MSQEDKAFTAVLLPPAAIDVFTADDDTRQAAEALRDDWRFARVNINILDGSVDTAIKYYGGEKSPDLIIVQTDNIDDSFTDKLGELAGYCSEDTSAIVIGPLNDVNLYRQLVGMGVSDYLVRPVTAESLGDDVAATILEKIGATGSKIIAMIGSQGGVGTTALSESLAWGLAEIQGQKTFLMDAAGGWSSLSVGMDFEPSTTLSEAIRAAGQQNEDSLSRMMYSPHEKLTVLSSGGDVMLDDLVEPEGYEALLDMLVATYPVIVVDLSGATPDLKKMLVKRAQQVVLVTSPALPAVRASRTLLQEMKTLRGNSDEEISVVVNKLDETKYGVPKKQVQEGLEKENITFIAHDPELFAAYESRGEKVTGDKKGIDVASQLLAAVGEDIDASPADQDKEDAKGLGKLIGMLKVKA